MKRTGKIIQIVKEEEYKKYGFLKYENYDFLNIRPIEEREPKKNIRNLTYFFIIGLLVAIGFMIYTQSTWFTWLFLVCVIGMFACLIYKDDYVYKNVPRKYWLNTPLPVKKPHNFKVGDVVEIEINIEKREDG